MIPRLLVTLAISAVTLSAQSVANEANKELPAWLRVGGLYRMRAEGFLNRNFASGQTDDHVLSRLRIELKIQPKPWMKLVLQGQDARIYFNHLVANAPPHSNPMDLRLGYLELGDFDRKAAMRAGRQDLEFGEGRLLGAFNWINTGRSFDAVRVRLRHGGYRLDMFASSVVDLRRVEFDRAQAGNNLHGLYGGMEKLIPNAVLEPYILWRVAPTETDFKTIGARWAGTVRGSMDYSVEMVGQVGSAASDKVRAWAGHWTAGYTIPSVTWKPRVSAEYNYASGDDDPHDNVRETFDNLYPTPHDKYGLADQVGWRNIHNVRAGWDAKPTPKLSVVTNYHTWWLATPRDALYAAPGFALVRSPDGSAGTHVGQEIDVQGAYMISPQMQVTSGIGHIFPGGFLKRTTPGKGYTFPFVMLNYTF